MKKLIVLGLHIYSCTACPVDVPDVYLSVLYTPVVIHCCFTFCHSLYDLINKMPVMGTDLY